MGKSIRELLLRYVVDIWSCISLVPVAAQPILTKGVDRNENAVLHNMGLEMRNKKRIETLLYRV